MQVVSASEARNNFSEMLEMAQHEPVLIKKQGRNAGVLISCAEYERNKGTPADRKEAVKKFLALADEMSRYAASQGMTEEVFKQLMAQDDDE